MMLADDLIVLNDDVSLKYTNSLGGGRKSIRCSHVESGYYRECGFSLGGEHKSTRYSVFLLEKKSLIFLL